MYPLLHREAPELDVIGWLNSSIPLTISRLQGKVIILHAFQMFCPACVKEGLPQLNKMYRTFDSRDVAVIGLHTVFEHHQVMTPQALVAFCREFRYQFPIAVDRQRNPQDQLPSTMARYGLRGTPSLVLIDRQGIIRFHHFGHLDDLVLGGIIGQMISA